MSNTLSKIVEEELEKLSEKERKLLKDKAKKQSKITKESLLKMIGEELDSLQEAGVDKVKNELVKVIIDLKKNFVLYKKAKLSDNNKDMDRFKKIALNLTKRKKELEKELDKAIGGLYADAELQLEGRGKKVTKQWWKKASEDDRERAMLSVVKDPDDIDYDLVDGKWEDLDGWMQRDMYFFEGQLDEKGKGLWHNIRAKRARGEAPARKGSKAYKKAKKAADDINASEGKLDENVRMPAKDWINIRLVKMLLKNGGLKKYKSVLKKSQGQDGKKAIDMIYKKVVLPLHKAYKIDPTSVRDLRSTIAKYGEDKFMDAWNQYYKQGVSGSYLYALAGTIFQGMERPNWPYDYVSKPLGLSYMKEGKLAESMIGIQTKANFKPLQLKGALERAGIKGFQMNRLSVTLTALKLDKKYYKDAVKIVDDLGLKVMMAKESKLTEELFPMDKGFQKDWEKSCTALLNHMDNNYDDLTRTGDRMRLKKTYKWLVGAMKDIKKVRGYAAIMTRAFNEGKISEGVSNYIHIERTFTLKDMKGKTVTLKKGMVGTHVRIGWDEDVMTFGNHKFDASPGSEWDKKVKRDDISVS